MASVLGARRSTAPVRPVLIWPPKAAPGDRALDEDLQQRQDQLLDEAVEETSPASDPISPKRITK